VNRLFGETAKDRFNVTQTNIIFDPSELRFGFPKNATLNAVLIEGIDRDLHAMKADEHSSTTRFSTLSHRRFQPPEGGRCRQPGLGASDPGNHCGGHRHSLHGERDVQMAGEPKDEGMRDANLRLESGIVKQKRTKMRLARSERRLKDAQKLARSATGIGT